MVTGAVLAGELGRVGAEGLRPRAGAASGCAQHWLGQASGWFPPRWPLSGSQSLPVGHGSPHPERHFPCHSPGVAFPLSGLNSGGSGHKVPTESPALSHREQAPMAVGHTEAAQASPAVPSSAGDLAGSQLHTGLRAGAALRLLPPQRPPQEYCRTLICFWFIYT